MVSQIVCSSNYLKWAVALSAGHCQTEKLTGEDMKVKLSPFWNLFLCSVILVALVQYSSGMC